MGQEELVLPPPVLAAIDRLGLEFLADILTVEVGLRPQNLEAWTDLGHLLTRLGRHERALVVDREIVRRLPADDTAHYNLACSLALTGALDAAVLELEHAVALGYEDVDQLESDDDLARLRALPRFTRLVARLRAGKP